MPAGFAKPVTARWIKAAARIVGYLITVYALVIVVMSVAAPFDDSVSVGFDPVYLSREGVRIDDVAVGVRSDSGIIGSENEEIQQLREAAVQREYGVGAKGYAAGSVSVELAPSTSIGLWLAAFATTVLGWTVIFGFAGHLYGLLNRAEKGAPFDRRNVVALRKMAALIAVGPLLIAGAVYGTTAIAIGDGGGTARPDFSYSLSYLFVALLLLVLSEVWRYGAFLQRDAETTV